MNEKLLTLEQYQTIWSNFGEKDELGDALIELAIKFFNQLHRHCPDALHFHKCVEMNVKNTGILESMWREMHTPQPPQLTQGHKDFCAAIAHKHREKIIFANNQLCVERKNIGRKR